MYAYARSAPAFWCWLIWVEYSSLFECGSWGVRLFEQGIRGRKRLFVRAFEDIGAIRRKVEKGRL